MLPDAPGLGSAAQLVMFDPSDFQQGLKAPICLARIHRVERLCHRKLRSARRKLFSRCTLVRIARSNACDIRRHLRQNRPVQNISLLLKVHSSFAECDGSPAHSIFGNGETARRYRTCFSNRAIQIQGGMATLVMSSKNRESPVGFKGIVGIASCVIGLGVVYFGYGIGTESPKKDAAVGPRPAAQPDRKRAVRAMNMALGDMVFFARDLGFGVKGVKEDEVDLDKIAARIEGQLQEIRALYRQEVLKNSALAGGLTLQLSIGPTGEVSHVRELSSRLNGDDFKQAVIAAASNWSFGEAVEQDLQVTCPLLFVHEGMDITTLVQWEKSVAQPAENVALAQPVGNPAPAQPAVVARGGAARQNPRPATPAKSDAREFQIKYSTVLRKDPDFSSPSLASFAIGAKVTVLRRHGDWLEVRATANGQTGFIRKEFVTPVQVAHQ